MKQTNETSVDRILKDLINERKDLVQLGFGKINNVLSEIIKEQKSIKRK